MTATQNRDDDDYDDDAIASDIVSWKLVEGDILGVNHSAGWSAVPTTLIWMIDNDNDDGQGLVIIMMMMVMVMVVVIDSPLLSSHLHPQHACCYRAEAGCSASLPDDEGGGAW